MNRIQPTGLIPGSGALTVSIDFARRHLVLISASFVIGGVLGYVLTFLIPQQWEARSVLQMGQIQTSPTTNGQQSVVIETAARAMERMKLGPFQDAVLKKLNLPSDPGANKNTDLFRSSLTTQVLRTSELLEIGVRGYSAEQARRFLLETQNELIHLHSVLSEPSITRFQSDLDETRTSLAAAMAQYRQLQQMGAQNPPKQNANAKFSEQVLLGNLLSLTESEMRNLRLRQSALEEQLNPARTFNTRPLGDVEVSRRPVFPKKVPFAVGGALLAALVATMFGMWADSRRGHNSSA
ncbi:hypothetical protein [Cupriavidus nantongensis]|uniref:Polysaccharide chain length determinant N-terminal domain-containing protein n=1 Tax=Cupriavidus nantongensis TaxID=1796606 RepID=A0A142JN65_9BURK|nr:hypothetical protein [Cupriavidus nantongensis]AMR79527.1 hypothetical protein A2G96_18250 [Cupriavidus nantongensis]